MKLDLQRLRQGAAQIRDGHILENEAVEAMNLFGRIFSKRYEPPGACNDVTENDELIRKMVEESVRNCAIGWDQFDKVLYCIGNRGILFGWWALENLPIVSKLTGKYRLAGKPLSYYVHRASKLDTQTYEPIRELFRRAETADRSAFVSYLKAHQGLQSRDIENPMVASHCDKWPAYLALWQEFAAQLVA